MELGRAELLNSRSTPEPRSWPDGESRQIRERRIPERLNCSRMRVRPDELETAKQWIIEKIIIATMIYFSNCNDLNEVKQLYKKLAKEHHPDKGGDVETMKMINAEYDYVSARLMKDSGFSEEDISKEREFSEEYKIVIDKIINIEGVIIELAGSWIWVTGNTHPVRQQLKDAGLLWAKKKVAWFWRPEAEKSRRSNGNTSLEDIRSKYGAETISSSTKNKYLEKAL